ncbi:MAG: 4'-phosphopantetheinyl transferase superfamily protein [Eubacteriales bacterium]
MKTRIYYLEIDDNIDYIKWDKLLSFVSKEKQNEILRFKFDIDKKLSLYSDLLIRIMICSELNIVNNQIRFMKNRYGKPYLFGEQNLQYNISHTRNCIVAIFSNTPVGIDVERITQVNIDICKRFFSHKEQEYVNKVDSYVDSRFFELWTKKESYIKYVGKGLSIPLQSFCVFEASIYEKIKVFIINDYVISVCCDSNIEKGIVKLDEKIFVEWAMGYMH